MIKEYKTLGPYFKKYAAQYLFGFFFLILTDGGQLIIPLFVKGAIDTIAGGDFELKQIATPAIRISLIALAVAVGRFGWRHFIQGSARRIETDLRARFFTHLMKMSSSFFQNNKVGDLMALATNDMNAIRMATGFAFITFIDGVFMMSAILVILFTRYSEIALLTIIPLPIITIVVLSRGGLIMQRFLKVQEGFSKISGHVQENLSGVRVVKSYVQEENFLKKFKTINDEYRVRNLSLVKIWGFFFPIFTFLSGLTLLLLLRFGGIAVLEGSLSPGDFVALLSYLGMLTWPMIGAGFTVNLLQRGAASLGRVNRVLEEEPDIKSDPGSIKSRGAESIELRNLSYTYPGTEKVVLKDINLTIPPGSSLGILGLTGSGKSTLLKILPRLLEPETGSAFLGGKDITEYDLKSIRALFGIVAQEPFLFSDTIHNNIGFGLEKKDKDKIRKAGELSTITRDMPNFPDGWETEVGERGIILSGGQKQRITIARAVVCEPEILICDDALSSVDAETEEMILSSLLEYRKGRTNIIISHRISALSRMDKIIVLEGGRIVQSGTHKELLEEEGLYGEIHAIQNL